MVVLWKMVRLPIVARWVGWLLANMSFLLPVQRLRETETLIAFYHPQPSYPIHILIVPKKALAGVPALSPADNDFLLDLFQTVQSLVNELQLEKPGYRLIVNGGVYQQFPHLHFHLISGKG